MRCERKTVIAFCLRSLALWDSIFLLSGLILFTVPHWLPAIVRGIAFSFGMLQFSKTAAIWTSTFITCERFYAICNPVGHQRWYSYGRARLFCISLAILAFLFNFSRFFELESQLFLVEEKNSTNFRFGAQTTSLRRNPNYIFLYLALLQLCFVHLLPFCCTSVLNIFIFNAVRRSNKAHLMRYRSLKREASVTLMLMIEAGAFLACVCFNSKINKNFNKKFDFSSKI